jgi:ComF family protein
MYLTSHICRHFCIMKEFFKDFLSLVFPRNCLLCQQSLMKHESDFCLGCMVTLPKTQGYEQKGNATARKFYGRIPFEHAFSYLHYRKKGKVQALLHQIKYRQNGFLAQKLGYRFGMDLLNAGYQNAFDVVVPIPLHKIKLRKRGYNQSLYFAKGLSEALGIALAGQAVERVINTETQTNKGRIARWKNVETIFVVKQKDMVEGKHVLLVDDVVTTGATLESCATELLDRGGCFKISIAALADAVHD